MTVRKQYESAKAEVLDEIMLIDIDGTEFKCKPNRIGVLTQIDLGGISVTRNSDAVWQFFRSALGDDFERFHEFVLSPDHVIEADTLNEIIKDMIEFTTGRPTELPSS